MHHTGHSHQSKGPRFQILDDTYTKALNQLISDYPILSKQMEFHLSDSERTRKAISSQSVWVWPKFDRRPVTFLVFMESFAPCIWNPNRQEGITLKWLLPPNFCRNGPIVFLANVLSGESVLQVEDILIHGGTDIWSSVKFSDRWEKLRTVWNQIPQNQPLLTLTPRVVTPVSIDKWKDVYDPTLWWIIQPDVYGQQRWYWHDNITPQLQSPKFIPKTLERKPHNFTLCALCKPYTKLNLPDTYSLVSQEGNLIGLAGISNIGLSLNLKSLIGKFPEGFPVEVVWNSSFEKFQITSVMPSESVICPQSFFTQKSLSATNNRENYEI